MTNRHKPDFEEDLAGAAGREKLGQNCMSQ
jgi:hypothetical protein